MHPLHVQSNVDQTVGGTVDEAAYLYSLMERSCSDPESLYWEFQPDLEFEQAQSNGKFEI